MRASRLSPLLFVLLAGCGSLRVQVDIINPEVVEAEHDRKLLRDRMPLIRGADDAAVDLLVDARQQAHYEFYARIVDVRKADAQRLTAGSTGQRALIASADAILDDAKRSLDPIYSRLRARLKQLDADIRANDAATPRDEARLASLIRQRGAMLAENDRIRATDVDTVLDADPSLAEARAIRDAAITAKAAGGRGGLVGAGIVESGDAFAVTSVATSCDEARKKGQTVREALCWQPLFDETYGGARFGNVNLAIKMEGPATFTLKGMTFDPSQVAKVAAKAMTQGLLIAAQLAGVPLTTKSYGSADGATLAASSGELAALQAAQSAAAAKERDRQSALLHLAGVILREWDALTADDETRRNAAVTTIKAAHTAHKPRLAP